MLCNKGCGWNATHTTGFHKSYVATPSAFLAALPPEHPYFMVAKQSTPPPPAPPTTVNQQSSSVDSSVTSPPSTSTTAVFDKSKLASVLDHHECTLSSSKVAALCGALCKLLN